MSKRFILQVDGGGIRGITPTKVIEALENEIKAKLSDENFLIRDKLDLCCGTSTGAIIAGFISAGVKSSKRFNELVLEFS